MSETLMTDFWAPLAVGVLLWIVAEGVRGLIVAPLIRRRSRRRKIVALMGQAESLIVRAVRDGVYDRAWILDDASLLDGMRARYDDLTAEALDLFVRGEEEVALWAAIEFYVGVHDPTITLRATQTPRQPRADGLPLLSPLSGWDGPRGQLLVPWAQDRVPWRHGASLAPVFGDYTTGTGDAFRHDVITPNSDGPGDMLLPFVWRYRNQGQDVEIPTRTTPMRERHPRTLEPGL